MGGGARIVTASPPFSSWLADAILVSQQMSVNVADKVDEKMRDHIGDKIAPPDIENG